MNLPNTSGSMTLSQYPLPWTFSIVCPESLQGCKLDLVKGGSGGTENFWGLQPAGRLGSICLSVLCRLALTTSRVSKDSQTKALFETSLINSQDFFKYECLEEKCSLQRMVKKYGDEETKLRYEKYKHSALVDAWALLKILHGDQLRSMWRSWLTERLR